MPAVVMPCGDDHGLAGLAYIEGPGVQRPSGLPLLLPLNQVLVRVLRGVNAHDDAPHADGPATTHDADAATLYVLMERNEWNVARVARLMSVARMTVYKRLRRAGVQRKRVLKAPRRKDAGIVSRPERPAPQDPRGRGGRRWSAARRCHPAAVIDCAHKKLRSRSADPRSCFDRLAL